MLDTSELQPGTAAVDLKPKTVATRNTDGPASDPNPAAPVVLPRMARLK